MQFQNKGLLAVVGLAAFLLVAWLYLEGEEPNPRLREEVSPERDSGLEMSSVEQGGFDSQRSSDRRMNPGDDLPSEDPDSPTDPSGVATSYPGHWLSSPAVCALADHLGIPVVELIPEIQATWPDLLEMDVEPLVSWDSIGPGFADGIVEQWFGSVDTRDAVFEMKILGVPLETYLDQNLPPGLSVEERWASYERCQGAMQVKRLPFEQLATEFSSAIHSLVSQDRFDRFPYLSIERFKKHSLPTASTLYSIMGAVPGSWV